MGAFVPGRDSDGLGVRVRVGAREAVGDAQPREPERVHTSGGFGERQVVSDEPARQFVEYFEAAELREHIQGRRGRALAANRVAYEGRATADVGVHHRHFDNLQTRGAEGGSQAAA